MAAALVIATIPTALAAGGIFSDVPKGARYADAVDYVYEHGIMNGTSSTTFSPNSPMTRAMLVTVLHRAAGSPSAATGTAFSDVPSNAYYTDAVAWASANGIVTGYGNGRFGSNDPVSRAQIATILWRYAGSPSAEAGQDFIIHLGEKKKHEVRFYISDRQNGKGFQRMGKHSGAECRDCRGV